MQLSLRDIQRITEIKPALSAVVVEAARRTKQPFMVVEGRRTLERQRELFAQGRTKPGPVRTWTMDSKHLHGEAVDLAPVKANGAIDWTDLKAFDAVAAAVFEAAAALGTTVRWGADWDQDGKRRERGESDSPHFELA